MKHYILFVLLFIGLDSIGQSGQGKLVGEIRDHATNEPIIQAKIEVSAPDGTKSSALSNFDGQFQFTTLPPGNYSLRAQSFGYNTYQLDSIIIVADETVEVLIPIRAGSLELSEVVIIGEPPLIEAGRTNTSVSVSRESITQLPTRNVAQMAAVAQGVTAVDEGQAISVRNSRADATVVFIDGVKVSGNASIPFSNRYDLEDREQYNENPIDGFSSPITTPLSTFGMDVDNGSYFNIARMIEQSATEIPVDAVRTEEFINSFKYEYEQPLDEQKFSILTETSASPWNEESKILRIGLATSEISLADLPPSNLVFLIDVSGSMNGPHRLGLIQEGLMLLTDQLREEDRVSIVTYAGYSSLVLPSTPGTDKRAIKEAILSLSAGGSTNGSGGIHQAYTQAQENFIEDGANRVILCTDGDFNVGISDQSSLISMIEEKRETGVFLSVIGLGQGNYQEGKMEQLANKGNGNFNYISNMYDARRLFIENFGATLFTVAKDAKVQVEFNPLFVKSYRLLGYENRAMADEDFDDDTKDGGEVGMGHQVTMIYEFIPGSAFEDSELRYQESVPTEVSDEIATISIRYKEPDEDESALVIQHIKLSDESESDDQKFSSAVAAFSGLLREDENINMSLEDIVKLAKEGKGEDDDGSRSDFIQMVQLYRDLTASTN